MNFYFYIIQFRKSYKNKVHVKKYQINDPNELKTARINQKTESYLYFQINQQMIKCPI